MGDPEPTVLLLTDAAMDAHAWPGHPERPERRAAVADGVADGALAAGARLVQGTAEPITLEQAAAVHARPYLEWLVARAPEGGAWVDHDTYVVEGSVDAALLAAGLAVAAARAVATREVKLAYAAIRPPGHHAHREQGQGFCLLNNVALAVHALRATGAATRIAICDWDVHHGDGTQAIFAADPDVFYGSTHQFPWYPGSGSAEQTANRLNVPLAAGSGDEAFISAWEEEILPTVRAFAPDTLLVSAGYDAHRDDPLAGLLVTEHGFRTVAAAVGAAARGLGIPGVALVLEGGYDLVALRLSAAATIAGVLAGLAGSARGNGGK